MNKRYLHHGIEYEFNLNKNFDLYRVVRASKKALGLSNYKLKTIEIYLGIERQDEISGKESVELYYRYVEYPTEDLRNIILLHNYDDIKYMIPTLSILNHIPSHITEKFYPFKFNVSKRTLYYKTYTLGPSNLSISLTKKGFDKLYHYHQHYSLIIDDSLEITVPIFEINDRYFVDVDLIDFLNLSFNDLSYEKQLSFEITNPYADICLLLKIFKKQLEAS